MNWWWTKSWQRVFGVLLVIGVVVYANSWGNKLFWDDLDNFVNNRYVHSWEYFGNYFNENLIAGSNLGSNYWRPMMLIVWSVCWSFWQDWGAGYRIVNLLLHVGCGVLIYQIWRICLGKKWLALAVATIFVIHPLQTEAITYASGISDPLSGVFVLGAILAYLKYRLEGWRWGWMISLLLMVGGLMSRETVIVLPGLVLGLELWLFGDRRVEKSWKSWLSHVWYMVGSFGLISGIYLWLRGTILNFGGTFNIYLEANEFTTHPMFRLFTFGKVLSLFMGVLLIPVGLHMDRLVEVERGVSNPLVMAGLGLMVLCATLVIFGIANFGRWRVILFGLGWFWFWIFPVSNLVIPVNGLMYEHWMYLPMLGFWTVLIYPLGVLCQKLKMVWLGVGVLVVIFGIFGALTVMRNRDWADPIYFYRQVLQYNPSSLRVWNNLAMTYADRGELDQAIPIYKKASELDPNNWVPLHNLGNVYKGKGDFDKALEYYLSAINKNPNGLMTLNAMTKMIIDNKQFTKGERAIKSLIDARPDNKDYKLMMVVVAISDRDKVLAEKYLSELKAVDPESRLLLDLENQIQNIHEANSPNTGF